MRAFKGHLQTEKPTTSTFMEGINTKGKAKSNIVYLAAEAKARQQALEQSWGAAAASRRQTRGTYGF